MLHLLTLIKGELMIDIHVDRIRINGLDIICTSCMLYVLIIHLETSIKQYDVYMREQNRGTLDQLKW